MDEGDKEDRRRIAGEVQLGVLRVAPQVVQTPACASAGRTRTSRGARSAHGKVPKLSGWHGDLKSLAVAQLKWKTLRGKLALAAQHCSGRHVSV